MFVQGDTGWCKGCGVPRYGTSTVQGDAKDVVCLCKGLLLYRVMQGRVSLVVQGDARIYVRTG